MAIQISCQLDVVAQVHVVDGLVEVVNEVEVAVEGYGDEDDVDGVHRGHPHKLGIVLNV